MAITFRAPEAFGAFAGTCTPGDPSFLCRLRSVLTGLEAVAALFALILFGAIVLAVRAYRSKPAQLSSTAEDGDRTISSTSVPPTPNEPREAVWPSRSKPRVLAVIPARLLSQRLPRKLLRDLAGRPLLAWTYEAALRCPQFDQIVIAVDSPELASLCEEHGWPYRMTPSDLASGTDRLHAVAQEITADIYVNLQGDEPLVSPTHIAALLELFTAPEIAVGTLRLPCSPDEIADPNVVKVVTDRSGRAMYFSRAAIPFDRDHTGAPAYWKHMGLYAYRREALLRFASLPPSALEVTERLEQLRLLEDGIALHVATVGEGAIGVDTEEDLQKVQAILQARAAL